MAGGVAKYMSVHEWMACQIGIGWWNLSFLAIFKNLSYENTEIATQLVIVNQNY